MNEAITLVVAVLLTIGGVLMPKPRSYVPALITLFAIVVVLATYFIQLQYPNLIPDKYVLLILIASVIVPVVTLTYVFWKENLNTVLGGLSKDNKVIVTNIIGILQNIYLNDIESGKRLSLNLSEYNKSLIRREVNKSLGLRQSNLKDSYTGTRNIKVVLKAIIYGLSDFAVIVLSIIVPRFVKEMMFLNTSNVPDKLGIGLRSVTDNTIKTSLVKQLRDATQIVSSDKSVNSIQKCLKYSHAVGNLLVMEQSLDSKVEHLMAQRFAEVASSLAKELRG